MAKYKLVDLSAIEVPDCQAPIDCEIRAKMYVESRIMTTQMVMREYAPDHFRIVANQELYWVAKMAYEMDDNREMVNGYVVAIHEPQEIEDALIRQIQYCQSKR